MASETKVVIIALLILAVGFFYTNVRDRMTGYAPAQKLGDMEEYRSTAEESGFTEDKFYQVTEPNQALPTEEPTIPSKEQPQKEVFLQTLFPNAQPINPCLDDIPSQLRTLVGDDFC